MQIFGFFMYVRQSFTQMDMGSMLNGFDPIHVNLCENGDVLLSDDSYKVNDPQNTKEVTGHQLQNTNDDTLCVTCGDAIQSTVDVVENDKQQLSNKGQTFQGFSKFSHENSPFKDVTLIIHHNTTPCLEICEIFSIKKRAVSDSLFEYNYLYFLLRAASDFFLRLTLGFS